MNLVKRLLLAGIVAMSLASTLVQAQISVKVRGTITSFDGQVLEVKSSDGQLLKADITDKTGFSSMFVFPITEIKPGDFVGVAAIEKKALGGKLLALELHVFPEALRGMGEGHREWDLESGSTMTNAYVDAIVEGNDGKEFTLSFKGGSQRIIVVPGTPVVTFIAGDKSLLKVGAQVYFVGKIAADGSLGVQHIQVGKDGLKPPM
jgi:hypothetical protein